MKLRAAASDDLPLLAAMNQQLIRDEGYRNPMSLDELEQRMRDWLDGEYDAILLEQHGQVIGYALYKVEREWTYLRQFFIAPQYRRRGFGRRAIQALLSHNWTHAVRIRLDVLAGNAGAIAFWQSVGFETYCLTMERDSSRA